LKPHCLNLIKDLNGGHILLKILATLDFNLTSNIYEELKLNLFEISTHKHSCCVLQKLIDFLRPEAKADFILKIISNVSHLVVDKYGNYIVQYVLMQKNADYAHRIVKIIKDEIFPLSKGKFSSNVVEKVKRF